MALGPAARSQLQLCVPRAGGALVVVRAGAGEARVVAGQAGGGAVRLALGEGERVRRSEE